MLSGRRMRRLAARCAALVLTSAVAFAQAQDVFPSRTIRIIVPYPPGASTDILTRLVAEELRRDLGQPVVIDNRPGSTGLIGMTALAKAPADGYTLGLGNEATHVTTPVVRKSMPYDALRDFTAISLAIRSTMSVAVNPAVVPAKTLAELIEYARAHPGKVAYGTPGVGSPQHLAGEWLSQRTGAGFVHAPYQGAAPATNDLLAGHVAMGIAGLTSYLQHAAGGRIRILAIGDTARSPDLPDVPTIAETVPDVIVAGWQGYFAPAGLAAPIRSRLNAAFMRAMRSPKVVEEARKQQFTPVGSSVEEFERTLRSNTERWRAVVDATGIAEK